MSPSVPDGVEYLLGHGAAEEERLRRQPRELAPDSNWLLDQLDIRPGHRAIDIGCGPHGVLDLLSERVGVEGRVVGLERNETSVPLARKFVSERQLNNVEVLQGDAKASGLPGGSFDVVHARLVLVNVPEPRQVVNEMVALARPGGMVASHEADWGAIWCEPSAAWGRLFSVFQAFSSGNGIDLFVGRKIQGMLRAAGLVDVQVRPVAHVCPSGHPRRTIIWEFMRNVRDGVLGRGLLAEAEFDELMAALKRDLDDASTLMVHLYFQAWGRKPD